MGSLLTDQLQSPDCSQVFQAAARSDEAAQWIIERATRQFVGTYFEEAGFGYVRIDGATDVAKVSVIGIGMRSHAGVAARAFSALAERSINIRAITTSEIKFSLLIDAAFTELAVRTLHSLYGLDKAA